MSDGWDRSTADMPEGAGWPSGSRSSGESRAAAALPKRLGRYEIVEAIAGGGMGFVYAGYDPELDRKVALKVVHPRRSHNPASHSRLIKEARALARLDHPNVVRVHDMFSEGDQIVVVMELVPGETLAKWEETPRGWRDVVAVYAQAAEGLAAAHALDIVHRDFKPSNAIIGTDGRVRVLDFGLARIADDVSGGGDDPAASGAITQTVPGAIMGTMVYSAPEQLAGDTVTPASDQFSFCVALHHALEGVAPFPGTTANELLAQIRNDARVIAKDRAVPTWARALVRRGLSPVAEHRFPTMNAVLRQLKRTRGWKRWRMPFAVALLVVTAGFTSFSLRGNAGSVVPCDGGEVVWDPATRLATSMAILKVGTAYAHEVSDHVLQLMDRQATALSEADRGACLAHRGGALSDPMFDRAASCLSQKTREFKSARDVLAQTSELSISGAPEVAASLRNPNACQETSSLLIANFPPHELAASVAAIRDHVATSAALMHMGRLEEAERLASATIEEARAVKYPIALAEAELQLGRILIVGDAPARAVPALRAALQTALENNLPSIAVEAAARRIWAEGQDSPDLMRMSRDLDFADAMSRSAGDRFARALLLNSVGTVYSMAQHPDDAMRFYLDARNTAAADPNPDIELSTIDMNIGVESADAQVRKASLASVVRRRTELLGAHHPQTLIAEFFAASYDDDPNAAFRALRSVCSDLRAFRIAVRTYVGCERELAVVAEYLGDEDARLSALAEVIEQGTSVSDGETWMQLASAESALARGQDHEAETVLRKVESQSGTQWWDRAEEAEAKIYLAKLATKQGDVARANALAQQALGIFIQIARLHFRLTYALRVQQAKKLIRT